jgi:hypothetical protein
MTKSSASGRMAAAARESGSRSWSCSPANSNTGRRILERSSSSKPRLAVDLSEVGNERAGVVAEEDRSYSRVDRSSEPLAPSRQERLNPLGLDRVDKAWIDEAVEPPVLRTMTRTAEDERAYALGGADPEAEPDPTAHRIAQVRGLRHLAVIENRDHVADKPLHRVRLHRRRLVAVAVAAGVNKDQLVRHTQRIDVAECPPQRARCQAAMEEEQRRSLTDEVVRDPRTIVRVGSEPHFARA